MWQIVKSDFTWIESLLHFTRLREISMWRRLRESILNRASRSCWAVWPVGLSKKLPNFYQKSPKIAKANLIRKMGIFDAKNFWAIFGQIICCHGKSHPSGGKMSNLVTLLLSQIRAVLLLLDETLAVALTQHDTRDQSSKTFLPHPDWKLASELDGSILSHWCKYVDTNSLSSLGSRIALLWLPRIYWLSRSKIKFVLDWIGWDLELLCCDYPEFTDFLGQK